jgi:hypothetical protein
MKKERTVEAVDVHDFCKIGVDANRTYRIVQEFDGNGSHRLCFGRHRGEWAGYLRLSELNVPNVGMFRGTSEYYGDVLPRVFQIIVSLTDSLKE